MTAPRQPSPIVACEQLARHWSANTSWSGGLVFADPVTESASGTPALANLYVSSLPERSYRRAPACSLIVSPAGAPAGNDATTPIGITCIAHAKTQRDAMDLLNDLRRIVRPDNQPFVFTPPVSTGAFDLSGVIGFPTISGVDADVWRFVEIAIRADIQPRAFGPGEGASPEGEAWAQLDLVAFCVPDIAPAPLTPFSLYIPDSGATTGSVGITSNTLTLSFATPGPVQEDIFDLTNAAFDTIAELRAAVTALGTWVVGDADATTDARPSVELFDHTNTNAVTAANKSTLQLHA